MPQSDRVHRNELIEEIRKSRLLPPEVNPGRAVTAVMCTLTTHLTRGEARQLLNSLPEAVGSLFQKCAMHRNERGFSFDAGQFFRIVSEHLNITEDQAESLSRLIFHSLQKWIPEKEFKDVESQLPKDLKTVWRAA